MKNANHTIVANKQKIPGVLFSLDIFSEQIFRFKRLQKKANTVLLKIRGLWLTSKETNHFRKYIQEIQCYCIH